VGELSPWHLLIVAVVFVLLFGSKKLPDAARSVGRSLRIFKAEIKGLEEDSAKSAPAQAAPVQAAPAALPASAPAPSIAPAVAPAEAATTENTPTAVQG
jgi:sec-independent protein translocase protein TatA